MAHHRTRAVATRVALVLAALAAVGLPAAPEPALAAPSASLTRYPYLTDLVGGSVTVNWATARTSSVTGWVKWGPVGGSCTANTTAATRTAITVNSVPQYQWRATLALEPDTRYCYRVYLGSSPQTDLLASDPSPTFLTQLPAGSGTPFSFAVFGDFGQANADGANPDQANLMRQLAASGARFAVNTGDIGYPSGSQTNYGDLHQTGSGKSGVFGPQFWTVPGRSLPVFPTVGNHSPDNTFLTNWPQPQAVAGSGGRYQLDSYCCLNGVDPASYASAWYAFDAGRARFYVLHTAWHGGNVGTGTQYKNDYDFHWARDPDSVQYRWLKADLAAHADTPLKFAVFHYPLYSDQSSQSSDAYLHGPDGLEGLLATHGVDLAFNGHAHVYQRNLKPHADSLVSYVSGGGGAALATMGGSGCSPTNAYGIGWDRSEGTGLACGAAPIPDAADRVFHYLLVRVDGTRVTVTPTDEHGRTFDAVSYDFGADGAGAPTAPGLTAAAASSSQVNLSWTPSADDIGVNAYTIYRDGTALATVRGWTTGYADRGLQPGTAYRYRVVAVDGNARTSPSSATITATTHPRGTELPFQPTKDVYLNADTPTTNYGGATRIDADKSPMKRTLMSFTVSGTGGCPIASAHLRLYNVDAAPRGGEFRRLADTGWNEQALTWATAPAAYGEGEVVASLDGVTKKTWYEVDVTRLVDGDGPVGLAITSSSSDGAGYSSREGPLSQRPELVVECAPV